MSYNLLFQQAINFHQKGNLEEAEKRYRQILEAAPENPQILNLLGLIAQTKGIHQEAINLFYQSIKADNSLAPTYFNLGISLFCWNKPYEALEAFQKALQIDSSLKEAWIKIGDIYKDLKNIALARQAYQKALALDSNNAEASLELLLLDTSQTPTTLLENLQSLSQKFPEEYSVSYQLAQTYFEQNELTQALLIIQRMIQLNNDTDDVYNLLGQIYLEQKDFSQAQTAFRKALDVNPHNLSSLINLANIETQFQNFREAEKHYQQARDLDNKNFDTHLNYANMLYAEHRTAEALEEYRQAIIINPKSAAASNNLGLILKDLQEYEEALGLFFNAYSYDKSLPEISVNIAETLTLFHNKQPETALKIAQNWLKIALDNSFAQHTVAAFSGQILKDNSSYSQQLFDNFAQNYEETLQKIDYNLPHLIHKALGELKGNILDLGCGTGLVGQAIKTPDNHLIGVDISSEMLKIAQQKNIYDNLIKTDIMTYLQSNNQKYATIIAADVLCYFSDLAPILKKCFPCDLCFSIEIGSPDKNVQISSSGRYKHAPQYVKELLNNLGYTSIKQEKIILRKENNHLVDGMLFIAQINEERRYGS